MSITSVQILIVGSTGASNTYETLSKLARAGWGSHSVASVREAETVLKTIRFNVVLSAERLAEGSGYDLAGIVARQSGTLFIAVALSETCLWLPVVERGVRALGKRALNPSMLEFELAKLLRSFPIPATALEHDGTQIDPATGITRYAEQGDSVAQSLSDAMRNLGRGDLAHGRHEVTGEISKTTSPSQRSPAMASAAGASRLQSTGLRDVKPATGTHGKDWRG
jgi:hypothetical protein